MQAIIHAADIQDRDGGVMLMGALFGLYPFLLKLYADSGYQGPKFQQGITRACRQINVEIVKRSDVGKFVVLPKAVNGGAKAGQRGGVKPGHWRRSGGGCDRPPIGGRSHPRLVCLGGQACRISPVSGSAASPGAASTGTAFIDGRRRAADWVRR